MAVKISNRKCELKITKGKNQHEYGKLKSKIKLYDET